MVFEECTDFNVVGTLYVRIDGAGAATFIRELTFRMSVNYTPYNEHYLHKAWIMGAVSVGSIGFGDTIAKLNVKVVTILALQ